MVGWKRSVMFSFRQYRAKAAKHMELAEKTDAPEEAGKFKAMERSLTTLADNEEWLARNHKNLVYEEDHDGTYGDLLASKAKPIGDAVPAEEEHVLRCLGAAVIVQWNSIPKQLQRELFDNAGAMGGVSETEALRAKIAR
jgi:hypothetical protein